MLEIENVSLAKRNVPILTGVNCVIKPAEITLLLGKSGSGKTSLLRCLAQIENTYTGKITLNGQSLVAMDPKLRGQTIGFVPQNYALFPHMNVLDNCISPQQIILNLEKPIAIDKALDQLRSLGMEPWINAYPHTLSGGQQQRVAIARALLLNASFLFLDEPTSALDPENVERLIVLLSDLKRQGKGIVIASQDMAFTSKIADRILVIKEGTCCKSAF